MNVEYNDTSCVEFDILKPGSIFMDDGCVCMKAVTVIDNSANAIVLSSGRIFHMNPKRVIHLVGYLKVYPEKFDAEKACNEVIFNN